MSRTEYCGLLNQYQLMANQKSKYRYCSNQAKFNKTKSELLKRIDKMMRELKIQMINDEICLNHSLVFEHAENEYIDNTKKEKIDRLLVLKQKIESEEEIYDIDALDTYCRVSPLHMPIEGVFWTIVIMALVSGSIFVLSTIGGIL